MQIKEGLVHDETGISATRNELQITVLLDAIEHHKFDVCIGGARRDEEKAKTKERFFSHRDDFGQWGLKNQRRNLGLIQWKEKPENISECFL